MNEIELAELAARLGELTVLDVRNPGEYDGTLGAPCDPRQGHIPGALSLPLDELMQASDEELRGRLALPAGAELVAYCHSGARSAQAVALLGRLGYAARNYTGSWHEWSRSEQPIES